MIRLDKFLCDMNFGTRSEVKKLIKSGVVLIDNEPIKNPDYKFDENLCLVNVKGKRVNYQKYGYILFHKPTGCVTAKSDNLHKTVMDYLPKELHKDYSPVGRLDLDTEGLLIITNDGDLNHHLISPGHRVKKTYLAYLDKEVPETAVAMFREGVDIGDKKKTLPAELVRLEPLITEYKERVFPAELTICEGRFHQVKRMFETIGCKVVYLKRLSEGPLSLAGLERGEYRVLTEEEVKQLKEE